MTASVTRLLYHHQAHLKTFDATVLRHTQWQGQSAVVLDETAFYPEAGGQMADRGTLAGLLVTDVQIDNEGRVHHVLAGGALPEPGTRVHGVVDWARRRVHMALHTGQHMLSRALLDVANADTVSSRLGETQCTVDLAVAALSDGAVGKAEELVNAVIDDDIPVRAFFPLGDELRALPLRRTPKVDENIRVVQIGAFDVSPCGGTHCSCTAQVGLLRVSNLERYKGMMRITFAAGQRARHELALHSTALHALAQEFTCGAAEVSQAVGKMRGELTQAREALVLAQRKLAQGLAETLLAQAKGSGRTVVVHLEQDANVEFLRALARKLTANGNVACVLGGSHSEGIHILAARGEGSDFDCGTLVKRVVSAAGGRGGGKPGSAEGRLPTHADFHVLVDDALEHQ
jgi:alanyl-tRNA synthetase